MTTIPSKKVVRKDSTSTTEIEITVDILADEKDPSVTGAQTRFETKGSNFASLPGYSTEVINSVEMISEIAGKAQIVGIIEIQIFYGSSWGPEDTSLYGRGTTPEDEAAGNTSLGFHESKHRENYVNHIAKVALPDFKGHVGMTVEQYKSEGEKFQNEFLAWLTKMENDSIASTDEVGYKKSTYEREGPRP